MLFYYRIHILNQTRQEVLNYGRFNGSQELLYTNGSRLVQSVLKTD